MKCCYLNLGSLLLLVISSCTNNNVKDYDKLNAFSGKNYVNAIIEIPAGTNLKIEYSKNENQFKIDKRNGKERRINFLPYLGNYGFIPSTYSDPKKEGDGDALDILVLSESMPTGTIIETIPIGLLKVIDNDEFDYKIIAIPADSNKRIIDVTKFNEFKAEFPEVLKIIETWFLNYDRQETAFIKGWGDEKKAKEEITNKLIE